MNVQIKIEKNDFTGIMEIETDSDETKENIIRNFFQAAGGYVETLTVTDEQKSDRESATHKGAEVITGIEEEHTEKQAPKQRSRQLPLLESSERLSVPLKEFLSLDDEGKDEKRPDHWETGIKVDDDGRERYKCRYWCTCGNKGNHYIPLGVEVVNCHECQEELDVSHATDAFDKDGVPERDDYGNFYVAK